MVRGLEELSPPPSQNFRGQLERLKSAITPRRSFRERVFSTKSVFHVASAVALGKKPYSFGYCLEYEVLSLEIVIGQKFVDAPKRVCPNAGATGLRMDVDELRARQHILTIKGICASVRRSPLPATEICSVDLRDAVPSLAPALDLVNPSRARSSGSAGLLRVRLV